MPCRATVGGSSALLMPRRGDEVGIRSSPGSVHGETGDLFIQTAGRNRPSGETSHPDLRVRAVKLSADVACSFELAWTGFEGSGTPRSSRG